MKKLFTKKDKTPKIKVTSNADGHRELLGHAVLNQMMGLGTEGIVEAQEKRGQDQFVNSTQMPVKAQVNYRSVSAIPFYEKLGFKFITGSKGETLLHTPGDDLFIGVILPDGWYKKASDHDMHSSVYDNKNRSRIGVFYKAASYDRRASADFHCRIHKRFDRLGFLNNDYSQVKGEYASDSTPFVGRVTNHDGTVLFETPPYTTDISFHYTAAGNKQGYSDEYIKAKDAAEKAANNLVDKFLSENYPNYKDPFAYWD